MYGIPILDHAMKIQYVDFYSSSLKIGKFMKKNSNISSIFSKMVSPNEKLHKAVLIEHEERNPTVYGTPILDHAMKIQ